MATFSEEAAGAWGATTTHLLCLEDKACVQEMGAEAGDLPQPEVMQTQSSY